MFLLVNVFLSCLQLAWSWSLCCLSVQKYYGVKPFFSIRSFHFIYVKPPSLYSSQKIFQDYEDDGENVITKEHLQTMNLGHELGHYFLSERGNSLQASLTSSLFSFHGFTRKSLDYSGQAIRCFFEL